MDFNKQENKTYAVPVVNRAHPPVVLTGSFTAANGIIAAGTVLAKDAADTYVAYVPGAGDTTGVPVCVNVNEIDTVAASAGLVLRHGMVNQEHITPNDAATISALAGLTIYCA